MEGKGRGGTGRNPWKGIGLRNEPRRWPVAIPSTGSGQALRRAQERPGRRVFPVLRPGHGKFSSQTTNSCFWIINHRGTSKAQIIPSITAGIDCPFVGVSCQSRHAAGSAA